MLKDILREEARVCNLEMKKVGRRKTAKHAQRGTGFDPRTLSLCRPTRGGHVYDCNLNWKVGRDAQPVRLGGLRSPPPKTGGGVVMFPRNYFGPKQAAQHHSQMVNFGLPFQVTRWLMVLDGWEGKMLSKISIVAISALALVGCASNSPSGNSGVSPSTSSSGSVDSLLNELGDAGETIDNVKKTTDVVGKWVGPKPSPAAEFGYSDTDAFDMQLHQSLKADLKGVKVSLPEGTMLTVDSPPDRVQRWMSAVEQKGGQVVVCPVNDSDEIFGILKVLSAIVLRVVKSIDDYVTYAPASDYNLAVLVPSAGEGDEMESPASVKGLLFAHKEKFGEFGSTCKPIETVK